MHYACAAADDMRSLTAGDTCGVGSGDGIPHYTRMDNKEKSVVSA